MLISTMSSELVTAIRSVLRGTRHLKQSIAQELALRGIDSGHRLHQMTDRDLEITRHLAATRSLQEIADIIGVSYKTIANTSG